MKVFKLVFALGLFALPSASLADDVSVNTEQYIPRLQTNCTIKAEKDLVYNIEIICGRGGSGNCSGGSNSNDYFSCNVHGKTKSVKGLKASFNYILSNIPAPDLPTRGDVLKISKNRFFCYSYDGINDAAKDEDVHRLVTSMAKYGAGLGSDCQRSGAGGTFKIEGTYRSGRIYPFYKISDARGKMYYVFIDPSL